MDTAVVATPKTNLVSKMIGASVRYVLDPFTLSFEVLEKLIFFLHHSDSYILCDMCMDCPSISLSESKRQ
jgi:hypothetical protein